ncbi:hypothetical protein FGO68_gene13161 [Halteria grandinella]|uniref:Uncharacterized protein n=1 Tax=Halteria grandinella TaxID=5974 RepID=A0A8J8NGW3_HALGN|nr:hypothetical protein FGO68_gene13161 [Halteria grandinella]
MKVSSCPSLTPSQCCFPQVLEWQYCSRELLIWSILTGLCMTCAIPAQQQVRTASSLVNEVTPTTWQIDLSSSLRFFSQMKFLWNSSILLVASQPSMTGIQMSINISLQPILATFWLERHLGHMFNLSVGDMLCSSSRPMNISSASLPLLALSHFYMSQYSFSISSSGIKLKMLSSTSKISAWQAQPSSSSLGLAFCFLMHLGHFPQADQPHSLARSPKPQGAPYLVGESPLPAMGLLRLLWFELLISISSSFLEGAVPAILLSMI